MPAAIARGAPSPGRKPDRETAIDPRRRIIDSHHHLWPEDPATGRPGYRHRDYLADLGDHDVVGCVCVESGAVRGDAAAAGLAALREAEFIAAEAATARSTRAPILAVVSFADVAQGARVRETLDLHAERTGGLLRGVRQHCGIDPSLPGSGPGRDLLADPAFRLGLRQVGEAGYVFDTFVFHRQLEQLGRLVEQVPGTVFVLNHFGVPLNRGGPGTRADVMRDWRRGMHRLARAGNVRVKIGGIGMDSLFGTTWSTAGRSLRSHDVAAFWRDDLRWCIDTFAPERCMVESNFPIDRRAMDSTTLWNVFQEIASGYGDAEQDALFAGTARATYRLADG